MTLLNTPKGTYDILPDEWKKRNLVNKIVEKTLEQAGYGRIETPIFESLSLFDRSEEQSTDIVQKEMYKFKDGAGRDLALRPEGTASVVRAFGQNGMQKQSAPVRLWYNGPFFRYEAVQAGRQRQFWQIGCETFGSNETLIELESLYLLNRILQKLNIDCKLAINMLPENEYREQYIEALQSFLRAQSNLPKEIIGRIESNPLRAFDNKNPVAQEIMKSAPLPVDFLDKDNKKRFAEIKTGLDAMNIEYVVDPTLVRGLDYYTGFLFEFSSEQLGAQSGIAGGGRYNNLTKQLLGMDIPAFGWGMGVERLLLLLNNSTESASIDYYLVGSNKTAVLNLFREIFEKGQSVQIDKGTSVKAALKRADKLGAKNAVMQFEDEIVVKNLQSGEQKAFLTIEEFVNQI